MLAADGLACRFSILPCITAQSQLQHQVGRIARIKCALKLANRHGCTHLSRMLTLHLHTCTHVTSYKAPLRLSVGGPLLLWVVKLYGCNMYV